MNRKLFFCSVFLYITCSCISREKRVFIWENGNTSAEGYYKKGTYEEIGTWISYRENGDIRSINNYKEGKKEGKSIQYYPSGNIRTKSFYKSGFLDGKFVLFYDTVNNQERYLGNKRVLTFDVEGDSIPTRYSVKTGIWKYYDESGEVDSIIKYGKVLDVYIGADILLGPNLTDTIGVDSVIKFTYIKNRLK